MQWQEVNPMDRCEAEVALASEDEQLVCDALVRCAIHEPDWEWVETQCLSQIQRQNANVKTVAITCLGHLARIHGVLHMNRVLPILQEVGKDPHMTERVEDVLDDIRMFLVS